MLKIDKIMAKGDSRIRTKSSNKSKDQMSTNCSNNQIWDYKNDCVESRKELKTNTENEFKLTHYTSESNIKNIVLRGKIEDFTIGKEIGKGAFAVVKSAHHSISNTKLAVKIYEKFKLLDPQKKNSVTREIQILKKIDHPNIVKLHEVIDCSKQVIFYNFRFS